MCKASNLITRNTDSKQTCSRYSPFQLVSSVLVACACMLYAQHANSAGGCGSVCLPLEALGLDKTQVPRHQYRVALITEYAEFDNFREGSSSINNPGGNKAKITQSTLQVDYGITNRWTASILVPYIKKEQETKKFGTRIAQGLGDVSVFGRYELLADQYHAKSRSISVGLGVKFPTGSIDEPNTSTLLPPAFQTGSGAYDLIPTASFFHPLGEGSVFGGVSWRIPLEENKRGYKFGQEIELNLGTDYPSPFFSNKLSFQLAVSYLDAGRDNDSDLILPARLRDGSKVLNTGGNFLDIVPGFRYKISKEVTLQARFSIPVHENWNGARDRNVGQVAPDITSQLTLIYTGR